MTVPVVEEEIELPDTAVAALVESEGEAQDMIADNLLAILIGLWLTFEDFYSGESVQRFSEMVSRYVVAAQRAAGRITEAHLREQIRRMGEELPRETLVDLPRDLRIGASPEEVYQRPVREVRYLESVETPRETAVETARERLEKQALTDLQLARSIAAQQVLYRFPQASGWRRIIHPELGNVCGLCIAASDRIYYRLNKLDLHPGCKCTVLPIIGSRDPGRTLNEEDLRRLYEAAGSTSTEALRKIRVETKHNGELGDILTPADTKMKGPATVKRQMSDRALELRRKQLEKQVNDLRSRQDLSQWHADRLEQLEELLSAA